MLISEVIGQTRQLIGDKEQISFSDAELIESANDIMNLVSALSGCFRKQARLNYTPGVPYYDLATLIPDYYKVLSVYDEINKRFITPEVRENIWEIDKTCETTQGSPAYVTQVDIRRLFFYPNPAIVSTFKVFYFAYGPDITAGGVDPFEPFQSEILTTGTTIDCLQVLQEFNALALYAEKFNAELSELIQQQRHRLLKNGQSFYAD
jgi:hypothetical protein